MERNHIEVLPDALVDQIAAGEVVERPASVVRELLDNALDAGAGRVTVEISGGGVDRIVVRDDGHGIPKDEAPLALERHATSKIRSIEDLLRVRSLGFRGEALPSIASVSRFELVTRTRDQDEGVMVTVVGGGPPEVRDVGARVGTVVKVEDLFFNVPARRKFLKTPRTESARVLVTCQRVVLSRPEVHLALVEDGREVLMAPAGSPRERLAPVFGRKVAARLVPFERVGSVVRVWGFLSPPDVTRSSPSGIFLFVNGRYVRDRGLVAALKGAYGNMLEARRSPVGVVFLEMDPELVDVNVHPQKAEVRFRRKDAVSGSLVLAVRELLASAGWVGRPGGGGEHGEPVARAGAGSPATTGELPLGPVATMPRNPAVGPKQRMLEALARYGRATTDRRGEPRPDQVRPGGGWGPGRDGSRGFFSSLRILGAIKSTYLVCEGPEGLVLVDQHAAHERVTYERLKAAREGGSVPSQTLLVPVRIELGPRERRILEANLHLLGEVGLEIEPFGGDSFLVKAIPAELAGADVEELVSDLVEHLATHKGLGRGRAEPDDPVSLRLEGLWATMACHGSVRAGQDLSYPEQVALMLALDEIEHRGSCPHGRPVYVEIPVNEIERLMRRR